jgi:hypothetical protein
MTAQNSRTQISYVEETTFGVTPTTPTMTGLPVNTFNLSLEKGVMEDAGIYPDEQIRDIRLGDKSVSGDMAADLRKTDFDPFLESVMRSSFSGNTLKVGGTPKFFTFEHGSLDIDQYQVYTGVTVNTLAISASAGDISPIGASCCLVGSDMLPISAPTGADTLVPAGNNPRFDHYAGNGVRLADSGGVLADVCMTSFELNIDRGYETRYCIGDNASKAYIAGMAKVTGSMTAYFENANLMNRFINETNTALQLEVGVGSDLMRFLLPRVKFLSATNALSGNTGAKLVEISWEAQYDSLEGSNLTITRPAP